MLANLLPGLREIRAPLAAGYLFLVSAWVLLHDRVNVGSGASSAVDAIQGLKHQLSTGAFAAALTFVAYLLGALWEPAASALEKRLFSAAIVAGRVENPLFRIGIGAWAMAVGFRFRPPPSAQFRVSRAGWQQVDEVAGRLFVDVDEEVRERLGVVENEDSPHLLLDAATSAHHFISDVVGELVSLTTVNPEARTFAHALRRPGSWFIDVKDFEQFGVAYSSKGLRKWERYRQTLEKDVAREIWHRLRANENADDPPVPFVFMDMLDMSINSERCGWWRRELPLFQRRELPDGVFDGASDPLVLIKQVGETDVDLLARDSVKLRLLDELPLTARRLVGEEQELFLEVDRMQGEISFRFTLALPIAVATTVFAVGLSLPWWATAGVIICGWFAGWALVRDGWRRDRERNDLLISLLAIGKGKSPTFERLHVRAQAIRQPSPVSPAAEAPNHEGRHDGA